MRATIICVISTFFGLTFSQTNQSMTNIYIGNASLTSMYKISAFPDISMRQTVISSIDFNCTSINACETDSIIYNWTILNSTVQFYKAFVPINFMNAPSAVGMEVIYLFNDTQNMGSVLGLAFNSTFLNYYYAENQKNGFNVSFNLNSKNLIQFVPFQQSNYTILPNSAFNVSIMAKFQDRWAKYNLRMCISNSIDRKQAFNSIVGIPSSNYSTWIDFINSTYTKEINENYFSFIWADNKANFLTQMTYLVADFVAGNNIFVANVPDALAKMRGCDIFTGSLMLSKYDFRLVYSETPKGYNYNFAFNSPMYLINPESEHERDDRVTIWVIIIVIIIAIAALYYGYRKYEQNKLEQHNNEGYISMNIAPVELQEVHRSPSQSKN